MASYFVWVWRFTAAIQEATTAAPTALPPHSSSAVRLTHTPPPTTTKIVLSPVVLMWHEDNAVMDGAVPVPVQAYRVDICLTSNSVDVSRHGSV